jgi:hypothetical protein
MEICLKKGEELTLLFDALANEIIYANSYHRLLCELLESRQNNFKAYNESNTFWHLAFQALNDSRMVRLCRIYDTESKSLNIVNLLDTIKANIHLFSEENFRNRLQKNAFVDSLAKDAHVPQINQLEEDIKSASCQNPIVKKLIIWRNNIIAHTGTKSALKKNQILVENPISKDEIEQLLQQSSDIFNRYSFMYCANTWIWHYIGHDDYKSLVKFINIGLEKWDADIQKQIEQINKKNLKNTI